MCSCFKNFPAVNAEIEGDTIVYKNYYNISFAVGTDKGLVVPVIKSADELSFAEIEKNIKQISEKAKEGKLQLRSPRGTLLLVMGCLWFYVIHTNIKFTSIRCIRYAQYR